MRKAVTAACFVVTSFAALAASAFEGVWKVKDTAERRHRRTPPRPKRLNETARESEI
jgi:hypothetical protein